VTGQTGTGVDLIAAARFGGSRRSGRHRPGVHLAHRTDVFFDLGLHTGIGPRFIRIAGDKVRYKIGDECDHYQADQNAYKVAHEYSVVVTHLNPLKFNTLCRKSIRRAGL
jgi:hypothetical protein